MLSWSPRLALFLTLLLAVHGRKDHSAPHPHQGLLKAYEPGPFSIQLSSAEKTQLRKGQAVMKQTTDGGESGGAICVQDVQAPLHAVWRQILDLDSYKGKVAKINECRNYIVNKQKDGTCVIKTKMVLGVLPGYAYESYYHHCFHPKQSSLTWTLDYDKTSDFDDVSGHWHCEALDANTTRVFYACDIQMKGNVPGPVLSFISKKALKQATGWVKRESELHPTDNIPAQFVTKDVLQPQ